MLAIDAKFCDNRTAWQLRPVMLMRDTVKAYVGFMSVTTAHSAGFKHVCSGAWGCGMFNGDRFVKFLVQVCCVLWRWENSAEVARLTVRFRLF